MLFADLFLMFSGGSSKAPIHPAAFCEVKLDVKGLRIKLQAELPGMVEALHDDGLSKRIKIS